MRPRAGGVVGGSANQGVGAEMPVPRGIDARAVRPDPKVGEGYPRRQDPPTERKLARRMSPAE